MPSRFREIESFAARRQRLKARRKQTRRSSRWTAVILVLFAFNVALVGARNEVVRYLPQTASLFAAIGLPVNLRNLKFENVRISKEAQDGVDSPDRRRHDRQRRRQADRGAAPALRRAQRHRAGSLHLDRAAEPQHSRSRREAANSAAGSPRRRPTPAT